jgi:hypothetical protein
VELVDQVLPQVYPEMARFVEVVERFAMPADMPAQFAASGDVAIYTESAKPIHIIRKIVLRMGSLMNWLPT